MSPMHLAGSRGHLDAVRFLVEVGANKDQLTTDDGSTPLHYAAEGGHLDIVCFLIESGAQKDQPTTDNGSTPSQLAAEEGHLAVVCLLIECGADFDRTTHSGATLRCGKGIWPWGSCWLPHTTYIGQRALQDDSEKRHAVTRIQKFREHAGEVWRTGIH